MKNIFLILAFINNTHFALAAGGVNGGGADHLPDSAGSAWFLQSTQKQTVKVCFVIGEKFQSIPFDNIESDFKLSWKTWKDYIKAKNINGVDPKLILATNFEIQNTCGREDLTVYMGHSTKIVNTIKAQLFDPLAIAHRISYDENLGWGKGFIWIKPETGLNLRALFTHELGHMFGNGHATGTIMTERLTDFISVKNNRHLTEIDWQNELVQCLFCKKNHVGGQLGIPGSKEEKETFLFLTKRALKGRATSSIAIKVQNENQIQGIYKVVDGLGAKEYPFFLQLNSLNYTEVEGNRFARHIVNGLSNYKANNDYKMLNLMGWIEIDGVSEPVIFEGESSPFEYVNKGEVLLERDYPYRLIALSGKNRHILFTKVKIL